MRSFYFVILVALCACAAVGQQGPSSIDAEVAVVKHSWERMRLDWDDQEVISPGAIPNSPRRRTTPEYRKKEASEKRSARLVNTAARQPPEDPRYEFTYTVVLRNDSGKKIREIDWDYVFTDPTTREELGRRQFTSVEKIESGKTKKLSVRVASPPTLKISIRGTGKNENSGLTEAIEILRIVYADDTEWKASAQN